MEAILLVGGKGSRLGELTRATPKSMLLLEDRPLLELILDHLIRNGITKIVLACAHLATCIENYFTSKYNNIYYSVPLHYSIEKSPLGTGGAVLLAVSQIDGENFFVINGDTINKNSLIPLIKKFQLAPSSAGIIEVIEGTSETKNFLLDKRGNVIQVFSNNYAVKPSYIASGTFYFRKSALYEYKNKIEQEKCNFSSLDLELDIISRMTQSGITFQAHIADRKFFDIGTPMSYQNYKENIHEI